MLYAIGSIVALVSLSILFLFVCLFICLFVCFIYLLAQVMGFGGSKAEMDLGCGGLIISSEY